MENNKTKQERSKDAEPKLEEKVVEEGYYLKRRINLKKDTASVTIINVLCFMLMLTVASVGAFFIFAKFDKEQLFELIRWPNFVVFGVGLISYVFIHELLHALMIRVFNKDVKLQFFSSGVVSMVGAERKFFKWQYILVQLFPFIVLSIIFILCLVFLPKCVFLGFYCLLALNFGSSAGDFFMVAKVLKAPNDAKIVNNGIETLIFYKKKAPVKQ